MTETTELKIWLEKTVDAYAYEGGTNFSGELIMYYRSKGLNMAALCDRKSEEDKTDSML